MHDVETGPAATHPPQGRFAWRLLLGVDGLIALLLLGFFLIGLIDGTVSSYNIDTWLMMLAVPAGVLGGGIALDRAGHHSGSTLLLGLLAVPGIMAALLMLLILLLNPRWN